MSFFVNIGSKLASNASKINSTGKEYHEYLNNQYKKKSVFLSPVTDKEVKI